MYDNLYCKVFIDTDMDYTSLFDLIMNYIEGKKEGIDYIITYWCDISVRKNKEYNLEQYLKDSTDFLYWRYYLDMEPVKADENLYIKNITNLLCYLKELGMGVVIACDFEDEVNNML